ncbi:PREDICTED: zinc finger BED domain-containing protein RICESLEEPER 3 [Theobroma cacao]|uniref:Zinc finger BED domain-containing protein RICESLEEPER 3 n=1 Tax=Theobroma cacao TaxID=3641 RepID=A0AB32W3H0_THECC|nr:PREDICTED: zinc finger BED domain-containing protein RICESLEEPER 3 [Theobroma cacao]
MRSAIGKVTGVMKCRSGTPYVRFGHLSTRLVLLATGFDHGVSNPIAGSGREAPNPMLLVAKSSWIYVESCRKGLYRCFSTLFGCEIVVVTTVATANVISGDEFRLGLGSVKRVSSVAFSLFTKAEMESDNINVSFESNVHFLKESDDCLQIDQLGATDEKKPCQPKNEKKNSSDGKSKVKCKLCGYILNYESKYGTGNLKHHNDNCVRKDTRDIGQMIFSKEHNSMLMKSSKFDPEKFRELVVAAIVMHNLPLSFVKYTGIKSILSYLREDVVLIFRNTVKAHIIKMHKREKCKIQSLLQESPGRICLTFDLWTSVVTDGYKCLTAHFVDKNWVLQKRILNFSYMPPPHNGVALSRKIYALLVEWGIESKLFSITLDNASANDTFVDLLKVQLNMRKQLLGGGKFFHIRCCAHILNLIVQDGLKEVDSAIQKVRESIKYVKGSQGRKQKFLECVSLVNLNAKRGLKQDVPTRWNSTFLMLESALYFRLAFSHLEISDSNFNHSPSKDEWDRIEKLSKFLSILAIVVIFDPRYKIQFVEWSYTKLYGSDSTEFKKVKDHLFALYDEYAVKVPKTPSSLNDRPFDEKNVHKGKNKFLKEFDNFQHEFGTAKNKSQLEQYLDEQRIETTIELDILQFWKTNQFRYPKVSAMARDILAIPISTVASESAFSVDVKVLDQYRSSLKPDVVESILCCKDWLFGVS